MKLSLDNSLQNNWVHIIHKKYTLN